MIKPVRGELVFLFFFLKQKTSYDISTRNWSSDVCSSDLKIQVTADAGQDVEKEEHFSIVGGFASLYNHSGNHCGDSSENWTSYYWRILQYLSWAFIQQIGRASCRERV